MIKINGTMGVFIDLENMITFNHVHSVLDELEVTNKGLNLVTCRAYTCHPELIIDYDDIRSFIDAYGCELFNTSFGDSKPNADMVMAIDIINCAPNLKNIIICSGDRDFVPVAAYLHALGKITIQITSHRICNRSAYNIYDHTISSIKTRHEYTIKSRTSFVVRVRNMLMRFLYQTFGNTGFKLRQFQTALKYPSNFEYRSFVKTTFGTTLSCLSFLASVGILNIRPTTSFHKKYDKLRCEYEYILVE